MRNFADKHRKKEMIDPDEREMKAISQAALDAGKYLESTGKQGFSELSYAEYEQFIKCAIGSFCHSLSRQEEDDEIPF